MLEFLNSFRGIPPHDFASPLTFRDFRLGVACLVLSLAWVTVVGGLARSLLSVTRPGEGEES